jgi:hypothetical protein
MKNLTDEDVQAYIRKNSTVDGKTGCWVWDLSKTKAGYAKGRLRRYPKVPDCPMRMHRVSYLCFKGEIPDGLWVLHQCDNRACLNPNHLHTGTHQDNMDEMPARGRAIPHRMFGNNNTGKQVLAAGRVYESYREAGVALGVSDNGVRRRIQLGWEGYEKL